MIKYKSISCGVLLLMLSACASNGSSTEDSSQKPAFNIDKLSIGSIVYAPSVSIGKFREECAMLGYLKESLIANAKNHSLPLADEQRSDDNRYTINVEYTEVVPHKWSVFSVRQSSNATFNLTVTDGDKEILRTTKLIGSAASLGACDRLEKIATAGGKFVAIWTSRQINR